MDFICHTTFEGDFKDTFNTKHLLSNSVIFSATTLYIQYSKEKHLCKFITLSVVVLSLPIKYEM